MEDQNIFKTAGLLRDLVMAGILKRIQLILFLNFAYLSEKYFISYQTSIFVDFVNQTGGEKPVKL